MWTRKGILLVGLGLAATALGLATRSPGALGAGLVALAFVAVNRLLFRGDAEVRAERRVDAPRLFEGDATRVELGLANPGKRLLFVEVRDRLPRQLGLAGRGGAAHGFLALPRGGQATLRYEVAAPLLGAYEVGPADLRVEDPFGLFFEERSLAPPDALRVLPRAEDLRRAALASRLPLPLLGEHQVNRPGDGFDFFALREYAPGDTMRMVNWKASARSGRMMVNQMERTTAAEVALFVDGRAVVDVGPEHASPRVLAARAAASLVAFVCGAKDNARVYLYTDHVREIEPMPAERMVPHVMDAMAELRPAGDFPLALAVRQALPSLRPGAPVLLVSPLLDDGSVLEAAGLLLANGMILTVVAPEPLALPGADPAFAEALLAERRATIRGLRGFGALVVEWPPGQSLAAMLEHAGTVAG